ncbi:MAG TPA: ECF transporter S component [Prolixibacteraceae bacterium]|nr:ECF transporter S component [Prolixibacteraceae bacterium]HPR59590.1 ECF transporter S component [Prolixibacteraceae bacterium]
MNDNVLKSKYLKQVLIIAAFSTLLAFLNYLLRSWVIPGAEFITFRPQLLIPVLAGLVVSPWAGGFIALVGNVFGDLLLGYNFSFWHWSIANFFIGFIPGIIRFAGVKTITNVNHFIKLIILIFVANAMALFLGMTAQVLIEGKNALMPTLNTFFLPALISNTYLLMLLLPPCLIPLKFLKLNIETRSMFLFISIGLLVLTLSVLLFSILNHRLTTQLEQANFSQTQQIQTHFVEQSFRAVGVLMLLIIIVSTGIGYSFSKKYMLPISLLAKAANNLKLGKWSSTDKVELKGKGSTEIENLTELFNNMAGEVIKREQKMNDEIRTLKLQIDKKQEEKQVNEITETAFFKHLEQRSKAIREQRKPKNNEQ